MSLSREVYESAIQAHIRVTILILSALSIGTLQTTVARAQQDVNIKLAPPRCLDADLATINQNGTKVQLWDCWGGQNQKWQAVPIPGTIIYTIRNVQSGRCLDADLGTINQNGTIVQLWDCWGGDNQKWSWDTAALPGGSPLPLFNQGSTIAGSRCRPVLDADLFNLQNNGTKIQLWECTANYNQYFWNPLP